MRITLNGREGIVEFLGGRPWYVEVTSPGLVSTRTIWHRDNHRAPGPLATSFITTALATRD